MTKAPQCYSYIRFSTPEQSRGHSYRRQIEKAQDYARKFDLQIDNTIQLEDLGRSAYKGDHLVDEAALGGFLRLVREGRITRGSVLIVESLDRLSRQRLTAALEQFLDIIRAGITIVTLTDGLEYRQDTIDSNVGNLIISLTIMSRAHEESKNKGILVGAAWKAKREIANKIPMTAKCPAWLRLDRDARKFVPIPSRAELIVRIFHMSADGIGADQIARTFNKENLPTFSSRSNGWHKSYVQKILKNRAVIGEFQPHRLIGKKREPAGDAIPNYYPAIIAEDFFYQVQFGIDSRKTGIGGKNGSVRNLFGGIAKCSYCGASMAFINKGKGSKGGQYLVCDRARRGIGCTYASIKYDNFERMILEFCEGLDIAALIPGKETTSEIDKIGKQIGAISGKLLRVQKAIKNYENAIEDADSDLTRKNFVLLLGDKYAEAESLEQSQNKLEAKRAKLLDNISQAETRIKNVKDLYAVIESGEDADKTRMRFKLRHELRKLIIKMKIQPLGTPLLDDGRQHIDETIEAEIERIKKKKPNISKRKLLQARKDIRNEMMGYFGHGKKFADCLITFSNHHVKSLSLNKGEPLFHLKFSDGFKEVELIE